MLQHTNIMDDADSGYSGSGSAGFTLTKEEICSKIRAYNESIVGKSSGAMTLISNDSDSFQGCINVCICIDRPINMSLSSRPTSIYEALQRESELSPQTSPKSTVTHEQLPHNAIVSLHTSSSNTAIEVVSILLNKFKITDNPKSFALFEQTIQNDKEVKLRKVGDQERPLLNYLRWSTECDESKRFVLKENDAGDIMYEAFSIPELNNFLRVLEEEEASKLKDIQHKYQVRQKQIADRLDEIGEQNSSKHSRKTDR
ncbi:hypothetical protein EB796_021704 [Bugula neritina]|uniref:Uncharacterized protein n=1 Tax=Bugula neritina TaxID=10212 RepID=A0A7J7J1A3_BUGNE|nr:hypothetical protein EB796_021704 [Bugula neritina]